MVIFENPRNAAMRCQAADAMANFRGVFGAIEAAEFEYYRHAPLLLFGYFRCL